MQLLDDSFTRPTSNTSPTMCIIFTLKSSKVIVYAVLFTNTFCKFVIQMLQNFYDQMLFLLPTEYGNGDQ